MADEQIIRLLEEIRDLQKAHVENYKDALKNQRESIEIQNRAMRRQRLTTVTILVVLIAFLVFLAWISHSPHGTPN